MTYAKHEAPAEGAGERERLTDAYIAGAMSVHEYWTENPGEAPRGDPEFDEAAGDYAYSILSDLRARSSAPEAREGEAVAWRGHRKNWAPGYWVAFTERPDFSDVAAYEIQPLFTHPAAPSADKLRIAVEALEKISAMEAFTERDGGTDTLSDAKDTADQALAALKAEGA